MLFLFDGDCAFCTLAANQLGKMTLNRIPIKPYQFADLSSLDVSLTQCQKAVQYISAKGVLSGSSAIAQVLIDAKTFWSIAGLIMKLPVISSIGKLVYRWVAKNRYKLPGSTPACAIPTDR